MARRQARQTARLFQPLTIVTDKAQSYGKVIGEWNARLGPAEAIRHITRKHESSSASKRSGGSFVAMNRIEGDHAALKHRLRSMHSLQSLQSLQSLSSAKATLKGIGLGVLNEIPFDRDLFADFATAA